MEGLPFDGVDDKHLFTQFVGLRTLLAGMGKPLGNRLAVWGRLQRQKIVVDREYGVQTAFTRQFADKYLKRFQEANYYENVYHLTVLIKTDYLDSGIKEAEEQIQILMRSLEPYEPYLLTAYQNEDGVPFSEVYSFFGSLINGSYEEIPLSAVDAYQTIAGSNLHFGSDLCEIRAQNGTRKFAQMFDLKDFGLSKPKILTSILRLPCEFTFTQSLVFINPYEMQGEIRKQLNNLTSVNDKATGQIEELEEGQGLLTSGELMFGDYHAALVVYGKTAEEASANGARAYSTFLNSGGYRFTKAGLSAPATFFSQVPGSREKPRSFPKTTTNFATTFGIHNYSHGKKLGNVHQQQAAELVKALQKSERPKHPYFQEVMKTRGYILAEYGLIAKELYKMGHKSEAQIISQLAKDMAGQLVTTKAQQQYDNAQGLLNGQEKQHEHSQDSEPLR